MAQISNAQRKTKVIRVPKKYEFLIKSYAAFLAAYPDKAKLWDCETFLQQRHEESKHKPGCLSFQREIAKANSEVFKLLEKH